MKILDKNTIIIEFRRTTRDIASVRTFGSLSPSLPGAGFCSYIALYRTDHNATIITCLS